MKRLHLLLLAPLLLLAACGGAGRSGAAAARLDYADPAGPGWRWVRNAPLSSGATLVLDLQGPGGPAAGRGVVFALQARSPVLAWAGVQGAGTSPVQNLAFDPGPGLPLQRTSVQGGLLQAGIFQKGQGNAVPLDGAICRVVLVLQPGAWPGQAVALGVPVFKVFPSTGTRLVDAPCAAGTLSVR